MTPNLPGGRFQRPDSAWRSWITTEGCAGPTGESHFRADSDRYHLYVSLACPLAHRTLIMRELKGLEKLIPVSAGIAETINLAHVRHHYYCSHKPSIHLA